MANPLLTIAAIFGTIFYLPQGPVRIGDRLGPGTVTYTWRDGTIDFKPPFTGTIRQHPCSVMAIDRLRFTPKGSLDMSIRLRSALLCGSSSLVTVRTRFNNKDSRLVLKTPRGSEAIVKGTELGFSLDESDRGIVAVREGSVEASSPKNVVSVPAGYFSQELASGVWSEAKKIPTIEVEVRSRVGNLGLLRSNAIRLSRGDTEIVTDNGYAWVEMPATLTAIDLSGRAVQVTVPFLRN